MVSNSPISYYKEFLEENWMINEGTTCFTWFNACEVKVAASIFGADLHSTKPMSYFDAYDEAFVEMGRNGRGNVVLFDAAGQWNIAVEPYGWQGMDKQIIEEVASSGDVLSVCIAAGTSHHRVTYAHNGHVLYVVRWLDEQESPVPRALDEHLNGLSLFGDVDADEWKASALALAERFTGVRLDREWLMHQHMRYLVR